MNVTWKDVDDYVDEVVIHYASKELTGVYGVPRGGVILAVMLSHALNIPFLSAPCEGCLVVDEISDTGSTLLHYREKKYQITTMFCNPETKVIPDFYKKLKHDEWVVFPWERRIP